MTLKSDRHPCVTLALIASMPRVFEAIQDKCITKANCKKDSKQFYVSVTIKANSSTVNTSLFIIFRSSIRFRVSNVRRFKKTERLDR